MLDSIKKDLVLKFLSDEKNMVEILQTVVKKKFKGNEKLQKCDDVSILLNTNKSGKIFLGVGYTKGLKFEPLEVVDYNTLFEAFKTLDLENLNEIFN